jgi:hypothetical protein
MARAELRRIVSNDVGNWREWTPVDPENVMHWFSLDIGLEGDEGTAIFQTAVATRRALKDRRDKRKPFKGFVLDPYDPTKIEPMLREYVSGVTGLHWDAIAEKLQARMLYEYAR